MLKNNAVRGSGEASSTTHGCTTVDNMVEDSYLLDEATSSVAFEDEKPGV